MGHTKFKIRTRKTKHYFTVFVFDTKQEMYDHFDKYCSKNEFKNLKEKDWAARCCPWYIIDIQVGKDDTIKNDLGELLFYKERVGAGVAAHEMVHAGLHYDRAINNNSKAEYGDADSYSEKEEDLAYAVGDLQRSFTTQCYKYGVY